MQMGLVEGDLERDQLAAGVDLQAPAGGRPEPHIPPLAERDRVQVTAQMGCQQVLPGGDDGHASRGQLGDQLGLRRRDRLDAPQKLQVNRADAHDHPHVGLGDASQLGDLPAPAHRHLQDQHLGALRCGQDLQRDPDLRVEVGPRGDGLAVRGQHGQQQVLGRRLAGRPGHADDLGPQLAPPRRGQAVEGVERIRSDEDHRIGLSGLCGLGVLGCGQDTPRAGGQGGPGKASSIHVLPRQPNEQRPRSRVPGVDRHPFRAAFGRTAAAPQRGSGGPGNASRAPASHLDRATLLSTSLATVTSSNGTLRPASNSWPCS